MEPLEARLAAIEDKVEHVRKTTDKIYKIFIAAAILAVISFVLPLIGLAFVLPGVISTYSSMLTL